MPPDQSPGTPGAGPAGSGTAESGTAESGTAESGTGGASGSHPDLNVPPPAPPREPGDLRDVLVEPPPPGAPADAGPEDPPTRTGPGAAAGAARRSTPGEDMERWRREAGVDDSNPFGRPGRPLRMSWFHVGFAGALGVFAAWVLVQAIISVRSVLILIVVSLFLAIGLSPAVDGMQRRGLSRRWAISLVFIGVIAVFVGFGFAIVPPLTEQTSAFIANLPDLINQLQSNRTLNDLNTRYQVLDNAREYLTSGDLGRQAFGGILGVGRIVLSAFFSVLTILILTLYFLGSLPAIKSLFYQLIPRSRRARAALLGDEIVSRVGGYVGGQLTISLIAGLAAYLFLIIAGVPYALPLALIVSVTALIPLVGATIGAVLVCVVAFLSEGLWVGVAAVVFFLIYQQVENYLIYPRIMGMSVNVPPAATIIAALLGGALLGIVGALLAIPMAAAVSLILREVVMPRQEGA